MVIFVSVKVSRIFELSGSEEKLPLGMGTRFKSSAEKTHPHGTTANKLKNARNKTI